MLFYKLIVDGLDADHLTVHALRGREALSEAYSFRLRVSAKSDRGDVEHLALGQRATLVWEVGRMEAVNPAPRVLHGVVAAVRVLPKGDEGQIQCRIHFVPRLWLLKRKRRTRIFQNMRVSDVVAKVLMEQGIAVRWQLVRDYPLRPYCTQYEESDFEFVTRILAEAGIYFYFLQGGAVDEVSMVASTAAGTLGAAAADVVAASFSSPLIPGDTIVCADDAAFYPPVGGAAFVAARLATTTLAFASEVAAGSVSVASSGSTSVTVGATVAAGGATEAASVQAAPTLQYLTMLEGAVSRSDKVTHLELQTSVRSTAAVFRDYDPERPLTTLESAARSVAPFPESTLKTLASVAAQAGSFVGAAAPPGQLSSALAGAAGDAATALDHAFGEKAAPYLEVYDHHAPFLFPSWAVASEDASRTMRQERRRAVLARGRSGCSDLAAGHKFVLSGHPTSRFDQAYVVASVEHRAWASQHGTRARSRPRNVYEERV